MSRSHPGVEEDIRAAWLWYRERSLQAATNFEAEVRAAFVIVEEGPDRWPKTPLGVRRYKLKGFPYSVVYLNDEGGLYFLAVAHGHRGPDAGRS